MASEFYPCVSHGCNRKYKTVTKWLAHVKGTHGIENPALPPVITVGKKDAKHYLKSTELDLVKQMKEAQQQAQREQEERILDLARLKLQRDLTLQERALKDVDECIVCMDRPKDCAPVPCGHAQFCRPCLTAEEDKGCPLCRTPITRIIKIHF